MDKEPNPPASFASLDCDVEIGIEEEVAGVAPKLKGFPVLDAPDVAAVDEDAGVVPDDVPNEKLDFAVSEAAGTDGVAVLLDSFFVAPKENEAAGLFGALDSVLVAAWGTAEVGTLMPDAGAGVADTGAPWVTRWLPFKRSSLSSSSRSCFGKLSGKPMIFFDASWVAPPFLFSSSLASALNSCSSRCLRLSTSSPVELSLGLARLEAAPNPKEDRPRRFTALCRGVLWPSEIRPLRA